MQGASKANKKKERRKDKRGGNLRKRGCSKRSVKRSDQKETMRDGTPMKKTPSR
jgi:hypothetical protein